MIAVHRDFQRPHGVVARQSAAASGGILGVLNSWLERRRQRRALLSLSDHMLKDIGISRADAYAEGVKPFWRS